MASPAVWCAPWSSLSTKIVVEPMRERRHAFSVSKFHSPRRNTNLDKGPNELFGGSCASKRSANLRLSTTAINVQLSHEATVELTQLEADPTSYEPLSNPSLRRDVNMRMWIEDIREMFRSMGDGNTSPSPYDTAWVSLIPAVDGAEGPQFPGSLQFILDNQLQDGSWGDPDFFTYSNNILNTLMCIIALKTWNTGLESIGKGVAFIRENLEQLENELETERLSGFEIVFPVLMDDARKLGLDIQYDLPLIDKYRAEREKKLKRIPLEALHNAPTSMLYSLEGIRDIVDWDRILKLQGDDGSFLTSAASTACAYLHTGNEKCLHYLSYVVQQSDHAARAQHPTDLFERLWVVDRLERLGIARYFESEIKTCLDYVYKFYSSSSAGVSWSSTCNVLDLDDSCMAFRLLRLYGYDVSPDCFNSFRDAEGCWYTFGGEMNQSVTATFNFYRAAQIRFPEDSILREGAQWGQKFLLDKYTKGELTDKYAILKDFPGEVFFALGSPWSYTPPHLEHRSYIDQYGPDDIWISKTLYRLLNAHNHTFLNLAKADFNLCQKAHQNELQEILRWHQAAQLGNIRSAQTKYATYCFYTAVCALPAPELSLARRVWTQLSLMAAGLDDFFDELSVPYAEKCQFLSAFKMWNPKIMNGASRQAKVLFALMYNTVNFHAQQGSFLQGRDISYHLHNVWIRLLESYLKEAEWADKKYQPSMDEYMSILDPSSALDPVTLTMFFLGDKVTHEMVESDQRKQLVYLGGAISRLSNDIQTYKRSVLENNSSYISILQANGCSEEEARDRTYQVLNDHIEALVKEVHEPAKSHTVIPRSVRQLHFNVARCFLHTYQEDDGMISTRPELEKSVRRILFEPVSG